MVAPFTGAWIEMLMHRTYMNIENVAPFTGAWIEMLTTLKRYMKAKVAPFTGAWIEICPTLPHAWLFSRRSLHGSVD